MKLFFKSSLGFLCQRKSQRIKIEMHYPKTKTAVRMPKHEQQSQKR